MASLYLHIPFCKQACHYCNFHFSTQLKLKSDFVQALILELKYRSVEFQDTVVENIYFGCGTPSLLSRDEQAQLFKTIFAHYRLATELEITLEANPDDLTPQKIQELADSPINRLSIGVQSFFEEDLTLLHRTHNAQQAINALVESKKWFDNISIDLIYGIPSKKEANWRKNLDLFFSFELPHLSAYALTVEPRTALAYQLKNHLIQLPQDHQYLTYYQLLLEQTFSQGYDNYEFSNFGKETYFSNNNLAYWTGKKYLGLGPSAHSYNGKQRSWNVANNAQYIKAWLSEKKPLFEKETLSLVDQFNEYIMVGLRTKWGISRSEIQARFGQKFLRHFDTEKKALELQNKLQLINNRYLIPKEMKFQTDGISSDLFYLD